MSEEESHIDIESWLAEPFTQRTREQISKELIPACLSRLLHAAHHSTDPKVTAAYQSYVSALTLKALFSNGDMKS